MKRVSEAKEQHKNNFKEVLGIDAKDIIPKIEKEI